MAIYESMVVSTTVSYCSILNGLFNIPGKRNENEISVISFVNESIFMRDFTTTTIKKQSLNSKQQHLVENSSNENCMKRDQLKIFQNFNLLSEIFILVETF